MSDFIILRMDILDRKSYPKDSLFRFVVKDKKPYLDIDNTLEGRGYYILKDKEHILLALKKRRFPRSIDQSYLEDFVKELIDAI